ncbi:MAG: hypothetical protein U1A77_14030 [Pirellulales bacterium]
MATKPTSNMLDRIKAVFTTEDDDWSALRQLVESGDADSAASWLDRRGFARDLLPLVAIVIERRRELLAEHEAGEAAKVRRPIVLGELEALRRFEPKSCDDALEAAARIRERAAQANDLLRSIGIGDSASYILKGIHQAFGELFGLAPARQIDAGCDNAILAWFRERGLEFYRRDSWKLKVTAPQVETAPRKRLKAVFEN